MSSRNKIRIQWITYKIGWSCTCSVFFGGWGWGWVQTVSTVPSCIHAMNSWHVSSQRNPTARLEDFFTCPHVASVTSRVRCFSASIMRGWIMLTEHVATIYGMYVRRHGGYSLHRPLAASKERGWLRVQATDKLHTLVSSPKNCIRSLPHKCGIPFAAENNYPLLHFFP